MARENVSTTAARPVRRPAKDVWAALRRFEDLGWALGHGVTAFESEGAGIGMRRTAIAPGDGGRIVEELTALDESLMSIEYVVVEGGLPMLEDYVARVRVESRGAQSAIEWSCRASASEAEVEQAQSILDGMADRMAELFAAQFEP